MKRILMLIMMLPGVCSQLKGEMISVPLNYSKTGNVHCEHSITGYGLFISEDKYVFAFRISNLKKFAEGGNAAASVYFNTDNDRNTGRFAGSAGWDFQINIRIDKKTIDTTQWKDNKGQGLPLYVDDYLVDFQGDILYVAIRREAVKNISFNEKYQMRIIGASVISKLEWINVPVNQKTVKGYFEPAWNFHRFGGERQRLKKVSECEEIIRNDGLKVWNTFGERFGENEEMPLVKAKKKALRISGARGEQECAFFAVTAPETLNDMKVIPSELVHSSGSVIQSGDMIVRYPGFVGTLREEYVTDILYPSFKPGRSINNFALVRVNIPRDVPAGTYKGKLALFVNSKEVEPIPFEVEVYDFDMPDRPFFATAYCVKPHYIQRYFKKITPQQSILEAKAQFALAKSYRFSPRFSKTGRTVKWGKDDQALISWDDSVLAEYFHKDKFTFMQDTFFQLGSHVTPYPANVQKLKMNDPKSFEKRLGQVAKDACEHYKKLGILDKVFFIFWDEPYESVYPLIIQAISIAKKYAPEMPCGVAIGHYEPKLAKYFDIWNTFLGTGVKIRAMKSEKHKKIMVYNQVGMGDLNAPACLMRYYYFIAMKYDFNAYEYSEINVYNSYEGMKRNDIPYNKWVNMCWFYPGSKPGTPFPSLRMEHTRDGLDDYDYLSIYKKLSGGKLPDYIMKIMPSAGTDGFVNLPDRSTRNLAAARDRLAEEIVRMKKKADERTSGIPVRRRRQERD